MNTVIFACIHNAGRSQMAAAFFNLLADPQKARAVSAGTDPVSGAQPQRLTAELATGAQLLITMGCGDACPVVPGLQRDDWPLSDPKGQSVERVREIRDDVEGRVRRLLASNDWLRVSDR
jgi:arsenate reductase